MLKAILASWLLFITSVRLIDIIYIIAKGETNLPVPVIAITCAMILYGIVLLVKRVLGNVTIRQWMFFYSFQTIMILFNLFFVAVTCPFQITLAEMFIVGTFLDVLINFGIIYFCTKQRRSHYFAVAAPVAASRRG